MALPAADPKQRRALGRGLESLLPSREPAQPVAGQIQASPASDGTALDLELDQIERNPYQTRSNFDQGALGELAHSIEAIGVVQPIVVRLLAPGRYQLIAGERRWLASRQAGKLTVPAVILKATDEQTMEMTIVENLQRADLNPMEQARAYDRLGRDFHLTQEQMAQRTGKDRASVSNFLRLLKLPASVQQRVEAGELSFGHARTLLALESEQQMLAAAQKVAVLSMSVRQTESYVKGLLNPQRKLGKDGETKPENDVVDPNVKAAQNQIQRSIGLRTRIEDKRGKGRVIIEYSGLEDFDTLLEVLTR